MGPKIMVSLLRKYYLFAKICKVVYLHVVLKPFIFLPTLKEQTFASKKKREIFGINFRE